jgi:hypothetical protein
MKEQQEGEADYLGGSKRQTAAIVSHLISVCVSGYKSQRMNTKLNLLIRIVSAGTELGLLYCRDVIEGV